MQSQQQHLPSQSMSRGSFQMRTANIATTSTPTVTSNGSRSLGSSWLGRSSFGFSVMNMTPPKQSTSSSSERNGGGNGELAEHNLNLSNPQQPERQQHQANSGRSNGSVSSGGSNSRLLASTSNGAVNSLLGIPERIEDLPFYEEVSIYIFTVNRKEEIQIIPLGMEELVIVYSFVLEAVT